MKIIIRNRNVQFKKSIKSMKSKRYNLKRM